MIKDYGIISAPFRQIRLIESKLGGIIMPKFLQDNGLFSIFESGAQWMLRWLKEKAAEEHFTRISIPANRPDIARQYAAMGQNAFPVKSSKGGAYVAYINGNDVTITGHPNGTLTLKRRDIRGM